MLSSIAYLPVLPVKNKRRLLPGWTVKMLLLIIGVCGSRMLFAQQDPVAIGEIKGDFTSFTSDNLGNIYLLTADNQLKKFGNNGELISVYNEVKRFGRVYSMDASNPLKLILYYRDFSTVVELDRLLNIRNIIDLKKAGILMPRAVAAAYDNNIWVYDEMSARLLKIGQDGNLKETTIDLRQALDSLPSPTVLTDQDTRVYMYDNNAGIYVFDYYGALLKQLHFPGWSDFQVWGKFVFGRKNNTLYRLEYTTQQLLAQDLKQLDNAIKIRVDQQRLYILYPGKLTIFSL